MRERDENRTRDDVVVFLRSEYVAQAISLFDDSGNPSLKANVVTTWPSFFLFFPLSEF